MNADLATITPEARSVALSALQMHDQAIAHRVTDKASADDAGHALRLVKDRAKAIDEARKAMTRPLDAVKKTIMDFFRPGEDALAAAEQHLKREVVEWMRAEEAAARARAEAERKAAEEAARAAREAEDRAAELVETGGSIEAITAALETSQAAQSRAAVATVSSLIAGEQKARAVGVSTRSTWSAEVVDLAELVKAAAQRPELLRFLVPDLAALRREAQGAKGPSWIPGVRFVEEKTAAVR